MSAFAITLDLVYQGFPPKKSDFNTAKREVLRATAAAWHAQFLPGHFTADAPAKYGYHQRKGQGAAPNSKQFSRSYSGRKLRRFGHQLPLVFSGEGLRAAKIPRIRATNTVGSVLLPTKFNWKHPKSRIVMRDEITRILPGEREHLIRTVANPELERQLAKFR